MLRQTRPLHSRASAKVAANVASVEEVRIFGASFELSTGELASLDLGCSCRPWLVRIAFEADLGEGDREQRCRDDDE
jgi:hypothetical protein